MGKKDKMQQVSFLMEKLYKIDKDLGGTAKKQSSAKGTEGEFENMFNDCNDKMLKVKGIQKAVDQRYEKFGRDKEVIIQEHSVRNELYDCQKIVDEMDKILTKQARNKNIPKQDIELRNKKYINIKNILYKLMKASGINPPEEPSEADDSRGNIPSLQQHKENVLGIRGDRQNIRYEANDKEQQALQDIKRRDEEQNKVLENIYDLVDNLDGKVKEIGNKQDHIGVQIGQTTNQVDKANDMLDTQNKRLKILIEKYRAPSKFCLDMTLLLFIIGLIGVGYTMLK